MENRKPHIESDRVFKNERVITGFVSLLLRINGVVKEDVL